MFKSKFDQVSSMSQNITIMSNLYFCTFVNFVPFVLLYLQILHVSHKRFVVCTYNLQPSTYNQYTLSSIFCSLQATLKAFKTTTRWCSGTSCHYLPGGQPSFVVGQKPPVGLQKDPAKKPQKIHRPSLWVCLASQTRRCQLAEASYSPSQSPYGTAS